MDELLKLARETIKFSFSGKKPEVSESLKKKYSKKQACFVTLTINGELRGCIGSIYPRQELWKDIAENSINAAFRDPRFNPLQEKELEKIKIEISILTIPKKIEYRNSEELKKKIKGKGVIIKRGFNQATYLPQVWTDISDENEFISSLCEKAGLSADTWKNLDLEVKIYTGENISEK